MSVSNKPAMARAIAALLLAATLGLGACEEYRANRDSIIAEHGNAVANNIAVQTIDPWPPAARNNRIDVDGERAAKAIERYKAGRVTEPKGLATQNVIRD